MKFFSLDRESYVEIEYLEEEMEHYPSVKVETKIHNEGFQGILKSVWLEVEDIKCFFRELEEMDLKRTGKAQLNSMSPHEFILDFEVYDSLGHIKVKYRMWNHSSYPYLREIELTGGFEVDPSQFSQMIKGLKKELRCI